MDLARPHAVIYLGLSLLLALAALFLYLQRPLVVLAADHPNQSPLFATDLLPGQSSSVSETLTNRGLLPISYAVAVTGPDGGRGTGSYRLQVRRSNDGRVLYNGPPPQDSRPLGTLSPGESVTLDLTLSVPSGRATDKAPLDRPTSELVFRWKGQAGFSSSLLLPLFEVFVVLAVLAIIGHWLLEARQRSLGARAPSR